MDNFIGTSGWHYQHWVKRFYPENLKKTEFLNYYAKSFSTVEINNTFYRLPTEKMVMDWYDRVPHPFIFSVKASRYITHIKRLKNVEESLHLFLNILKPLKDKLGPILFQLPPSSKLDLERLEHFLKILPKTFCYTFEFRHSSWLIEELFNLLAAYNIAFCISDFEGMLAPPKITADFVYLRMHGPNEAYRGHYNTPELTLLAKKIKEWNQSGRSCYCYFDNDEAAYAVFDALKLNQMLFK